MLGVQFAVLFRDDLFFELARHANQLASKLSDGIKAAGYTLLTDSATNQIFPIFPQSVIERLRGSFAFYTWQEVDETHSAVRLVTSWATTTKAVDEFLVLLKNSS